MKRQQHTLREDKRQETRDKKPETKGRSLTSPVSRLRSRLGFTLVELMIVGVLLVILGGAFVTTFLSGQTSYFAADANIQIQQEARRAFDFMTHELRQSGTDYQGAGTFTCSPSACVAPGGAPQTQVNFKIARSYTAGAIDWGTDKPNLPERDWFIHYAIVGPVSAANPEYKLIRFLSVNAADTRTLAGCTAPNCRILANYLALGTGTTQSGFLMSGSVVTIQLQLQYRSSSRFTGPTQTMGSSTAPLVAQVELRNP